MTHPLLTLTLTTRLLNHAATGSLLLGLLPCRVGEEARLLGLHGLNLTLTLTLTLIKARTLTVNLTLYL